MGRKQVKRSGSIKNHIVRALRSFRLRIILFIFLAGFIPSVFLSAGISESYEARAVEMKTVDVQTQMKILADHLLKYNYLVDISSEVMNAELDQLSTLYDGRVLIINEDFRIVKDTYGINQEKLIVTKEVIKCFRGENTSKYNKEQNFIEVTIPISEQVLSEDGNETQSVKGVMLVSVSTDNIANSLASMRKNAYIIEVILMLILFAIDILVVQLMMHSFHQVADSVIKVRDGDSEEIMQFKSFGEMEKLIDNFNQIIKRTMKLDESRQEFVSNVSHELKTPLTSMKVLADSLIGQKDVPNALYKEFMEDIAEEIERENKIITDLLELVKLDKKEGDIHIEMLSINEVLEAILKRIRPILQKANIELVYESARPVMADIDEVKFSLVITNLVENAVKYNKENGSVHVSLDADHQFFSVIVEDTGVGIPEEEIDLIFERFYRVDKSHSREIGGTGLGLAIARNAVFLHRGSIKVSSVEGEGTSFIVKIPLIYSKG